VPNTNNEIPDKDYLYGKFQKSHDWRDKLHRLLAHKSLDIGLDDDMHVDNSRTHLGITWKELAVVGGLILGAFYLYGQWNIQAPQQSPAVGTPPVDSEYEVRFFDAEGNPIDVKPLERK